MKQLLGDSLTLRDWRWSGSGSYGHGACVEQDDKGWDARKCAYCLKNPASYRVVRTKSYLFNKALLLCHGTVCVVGKMRDRILQLSKKFDLFNKSRTVTVTGLNRGFSFETGNIKFHRFKPLNALDEWQCVVFSIHAVFSVQYFSDVVHRNPQ